MSPERFFDFAQNRRVNFYQSSDSRDGRWEIPTLRPTRASDVKSDVQKSGEFNTRHLLFSTYRF